MIRQVASLPGIKVTALFVGSNLSRITLSLASHFTLDCPEGAVYDSLASWLESYARRQWEVFSLPPQSSPFYQNVASCLQTTKPGEVLTYQELATLAGSPKAARAVGNFCRRSQFPLLIPCHRVVPSTHALGHYTPDPQIKSLLLNFEGISL